MISSHCPEDSEFEKKTAQKCEKTARSLVRGGSTPTARGATHKQTRIGGFLKSTSTEVAETGRAEEEKYLVVSPESNCETNISVSKEGTTQVTAAAEDRRKDTTQELEGKKLMPPPDRMCLRSRTPRSGRQEAQPSGTSAEESMEGPTDDENTADVERGPGTSTPGSKRKPAEDRTPPKARSKKTHIERTPDSRKATTRATLLESTKQVERVMMTDEEFIDALAGRPCAMVAKKLLHYVLTPKKEQTEERATPQKEVDKWKQQGEEIAKLGREVNQLRKEKNTTQSTGQGAESPAAEAQRTKTATPEDWASMFRAVTALIEDKFEQLEKRIRSRSSSRTIKEPGQKRTIREVSRPEESEAPPRPGCSATEVERATPVRNSEAAQISEAHLYSKTDSASKTEEWVVVGKRGKTEKITPKPETERKTAKNRTTTKQGIKYLRALILAQERKKDTGRTWARITATGAQKTTETLLKEYDPVADGIEIRNTRNQEYRGIFVQVNTVQDMKKLQASKTLADLGACFPGSSYMTCPRTYPKKR